MNNTPLQLDYRKKYNHLGGDKRFGIAANMNFQLVCTYEKSSENPELVLCKKGKCIVAFVGCAELKSAM